MLSVKVGSDSGPLKDIPFTFSLFALFSPNWPVADWVLLSSQIRVRQSSALHAWVIKCEQSEDELGRWQQPDSKALTLFVYHFIQESCVL